MPRRGRLVETHPDDVTQLDQFGLAGGNRSELFQGLVHCQQTLVGRGRGDFQLVYVERDGAAPAFGGQAAAGAVHQNPAHRLGGSGEEMLTPAPDAVVRARDFEPGLVDQRGGLQGVLAPLGRQAMSGQAPQFVINQRQQVCRSPGITGLRASQNERDFAHGKEAGAESCPPPTGGSRRAGEVANGRISILCWRQAGPWQPGDLAWAVSRAGSPARTTPADRSSESENRNGAGWEFGATRN